MKEKPILFSAPMVRALLAGTKSVTRRLVRRPERYTDSQWEQAVPHNHGEGAHELFGHCYLRVPAHDGETLNDCVMGGRERAPYEPGDRLWVRERMRVLEVRAFMGAEQVRVRYEADGTESGWRPYPHRLAPPVVGKCLAYGGHREVSRIALEVTSVRVERLHEITEEDAWAEGIEELDGSLDDAALCRRAKEMGLPATEARVTFAELWNTINGKRASWASNPFCWVVGFKNTASKSTEHPALTGGVL